MCNTCVHLIYHCSICRWSKSNVQYPVYAGLRSIIGCWWRDKDGRGMDGVENNTQGARNTYDVSGETGAGWYVVDDVALCVWSAGRGVTELHWNHNRISFNYNCFIFPPLTLCGGQSGHSGQSGPVGGDIIRIVILVVRQREPH